MLVAVIVVLVAWGIIAPVVAYRFGKSVQAHQDRLTKAANKLARKKTLPRVE